MDWLIGFDADDTLWHNERFFRMTQEHFAELLSDHAEPGHLSEKLLEAERRNIGRYGFGIKGFTLSMIETALEVTDRKVPGEVIAAIVEAGKEMLGHPIELLPHAKDAVESLSGRAEIALITKGDLLDQERKLAQSGLGDLFDAVEIVSAKTPQVYGRIFARHGRAQSMMVGNSLRSDVIPAIDAGGYGVHVPHDLTFALEHADAPEDSAKFRRIADLSELEQLVLALSD
ncbi:HAD family hydrolase [Pelagovum pacificum]|uniref:HAD family hydrolase n=1 Tax=Pelagovum pacificum TaxID=2588711 RepID=A0A5C5GAI7_9RHOB|nr:HAD family hydrolase [Pelagovum pacificum]QQA42489.1 HAD family hydrolase [Pelagovum pacificum]TNY31573.1 HAD family hydrolase [Pelagovum pacificum]